MIESSCEDGMGRRIRNQGGESVSLLATTFVIALGSGAVFFLLLMVDQDAAPKGATVIGILTGAFLLLVAAQRFSRGRSDGLSFWVTAGKNHREDGLASSYTPRRASGGRHQATLQENRPMSVDEVREIQSVSSSTWVPSKRKRSSR
ncbi:MAG: hypothetical protein ACK526_13855 [Planctomyces sp.]